MSISNVASNLITGTNSQCKIVVVDKKPYFCEVEFYARDEPTIRHVQRENRQTLIFNMSLALAADSN